MLIKSLKFPVIWLVVLLGAILLSETPAIQRLEFQLYDAQLAYLRANFPKQTTVKVALIGIDEATVSALEAPLALWQPELGIVIDAAQTAGAQVIGFDIALPDRSFDAFLGRKHDQPLLQAMVRAAKGDSKMPVVFGRTLKHDGTLRGVNRRFQAILGADGFGLVQQVQELDGVVRRYVDDAYFDQLGLYPLVGQMARRIGQTTASGWIDYSIGEAISYVPMVQVLQWQRAWANNGDQQARARLVEQFSGKVVFFGGVLAFEDRHFQPVILADWDNNNPYAPGVLIHMQAFRSLASGGLVQNLPVALMVLLFALAAGFVFVGERPVYGLLAALMFSVLVLIGSTLLFTQGYRLPMAPLVLTAMFGWLLKSLINAVSNLQEKQRLRSAFSGYVSPAILKDILSGGIRPELGGESRDICVLFADIIGFTSFSESNKAEEVLTMINRYFDRVTPVVHDCGGTLDKYMGDGLMAFFGAPQDLASPACLGFEAACKMHQALEQLNLELDAEQSPRINIGIGLSFGPAVVGHVGARSRFEYSAIGDSVNVAARVEGLTRKLHCKVIVTGTVYDALPEQEREQLFELGEQALKGHTPVALYGWGRLEEIASA